jgi:hypothetical protein
VYTQHKPINKPTTTDELPALERKSRQGVYRKKCFATVANSVGPEHSRAGSLTNANLKNVMLAAIVAANTTNPTRNLAGGVHKRCSLFHLVLVNDSVGGLQVLVCVVDLRDLADRY